MSEWIHGYFILWVIIQYHFILLLKVLQLWPFGALSVGSCVALVHPHPFLFFLIGPYFPIKMPQAHFEHFLPTPIISHFSKEPWLPLLEISIRNQIRSVRCASFYWRFVSYFQVLSVERVREYTCVHEPVNANISINISVCTCLYLY